MVKQPVTQRATATATNPVLHFIGAAAICLGVILGPLLLGCTFPWPRLALEAAMTIAIVCWIGSRRNTWIAPALPIAVATVGLLQLLPLPDSVLLSLSPVSAGAWKVASPADWGTIAVDPAATAAGLRRLLLGLGTIGAVAALGRDSRTRTTISTAIAASCALVIALAYVFPASKEDRIILGFIDLSGPIHFWKSPVHAPLQTAGFSEPDFITVADYTYVSDSWIAGDRIGPYIVSNHFAGGIYLTLPVGIALWLWWSRGRMPAPARITAALAMAGAGLHAVAAVAKSRAGLASLILSLTALITLLASSRFVRRLGLAVTFLGGSAWFIIAVAMHGPARGLQTLVPSVFQPWVAPLFTDGRVWASQLAKRIFGASPLFGTGFGSYYGLSGYLDRRNPPWFFAHNDYFQLLAETGLVGAAIAMAGCIGLGIIGWRFLRSTSTPERIRDAGFWASIIGIAAHSVFDWNLHVPANAFLTCVVVGLAVSASPIRQAGLVTRLVAAGSNRRLPRLALFSIYVSIFMILCRDAWSDTVQRQMRDSLVATRALGSMNAERSLARAIKSGEMLSRWDPGNSSVSLLLGQLELSATAWAQDGSDANFERAALAFARARRQAATCRGIPERGTASATFGPPVDGLGSPINGGP